MSTRVYVPSTLGRLRGIVTGDGIGPAPFAAHAVTPALREAYAEGGDVAYRDDVSAARDAILECSAEAEELSERCLTHELAWWATQEIGDLLQQTDQV